MVKASKLSSTFNCDYSSFAAKKIGGSPIGSVKDAYGTDVEEHNCTPRAKIVLNCPFDGESAPVAQINNYPDFAASFGDRGSARQESRGGRLNKNL